MDKESHPLQKLQYLLEIEGLVNSPYSQMKYSPKKDSFIVPQTIILALNRDIKGAGDAKDGGQRLREVALRLLELGYAPRQAERVAKELVESHPDYVEKTGELEWYQVGVELHTRLKTERYLEFFAEQILQQLAEREQK